MVLRALYQVMNSLGAEQGNPSWAKDVSNVLPQILLSLKNEECRLKLWAGNLGAHRKGRASLDH